MNENDLTDDEVLELARETGRDPGEILDAWEAMGTAKTPEPTGLDKWLADKKASYEVVPEALSEIPGDLLRQVPALVGGAARLAANPSEIIPAIRNNPGAATRLAAGAVTTPLAVSAPMVGVPLAAGAQYATGKLNQYLGWEPESSGKEDAKQAIKDLTIGGVATKAGSLLSSTGKTLNSPRAIAETAGARSNQLIRGASGATSDIEQAFARLKGTPEGERIFTKLDPGNAEIEARAARDAVGRELADFYKNNSDISITPEAVEGLPSMSALREKAAGSGTVVPEQAAMAKAALSRLGEDFAANTTLANKIPIDRLWELRKSADEYLSSSRLWQKDPSMLSDADKQFLAYREALGQAINEAISQVDPAKAQTLGSLNQRYGDLSDVRSIYDIGQSKGRVGGDIRDLFKVGFGNRARAGINLAQNNLPNVFSSSGPGLMALSGAPSGIPPQPLPRNTEAIKNDPNSLNMVAQLGVNSGILPNAETLLNAPLPAQKEMIRAVMSQNPQMAAPTPDGFRSVMDGKLHDPMEQSMYMKSALEAISSGQIDPKDEPMMMGKFIEHKQYTPINNPNAPMVMPRQPVQFSLSDFDMALNAGLNEPSSSFAETDSMRMLRQAAKYPAAY